MQILSKPHRQPWRDRRRFSGDAVTARIIDGLVIAREMRRQCRRRVEALASEFDFSPGLAVILAGENPASLIYVRNKIRACEEVGIRSMRFAFPDSVPLDLVIDQIRALNDDPTVHGILVQLPLPPALDLTQVLGTISVDKDVDGFHLYNVGGLVVGNTVFPPCTPYGVVKLLEHERIGLEGKNVVVVGASNNVGKPMALMLMQQDATVCICHAKTRDLAQFTRGGDRCGDQSTAERKIGGRRRFRRCSRKGLLHHAGSGRHRSDDGDDAAREHDKLRRTRRKSAMSP
jgi:methylenetetrahydrofolate dehydrogenase (NADP+)/methenyltetrahydrofolate cyclohydrolase